MIKAQESIVCYNSRDWLDASPKERLPCKGVPSSGGTAGVGTSSRFGAVAGGGGSSGSANNYVQLSFERCFYLIKQL